MKYSIKKPLFFFRSFTKTVRKVLKKFIQKNISKTNYLHAIAGFIALMN